MSQPLKIAIAGASGRMGRAVRAVLDARHDVELTGAFGSDSFVGSALLLATSALQRTDVVIDFTTAAASAALAGRLSEWTSPPALVIGSTGFDDAELAAIAAASKAVPILRAGNFSLGVNMLLGLIELAARALPAADYDIEVFEAHHRRKVDAPSGTALMLGEAAARGRGVDLAKVAQRVRDGITGARTSGDIGFSVMRGGGIVGEHSVAFAAEDEILTLSHSARDRSLFARGAVEAALWLAGKPAGAYDMQDVLGLR